RMLAAGLVNADVVSAARAEPARLSRRKASGGNDHLIRGLLSGTLAPELRGTAVQELETTVELPLQREVETLARRAADYLASYGASALAAIVVDNASGDVLAYLGSPDFSRAEALGQNDGARALRQPGSTLKPFVYAAAMEQAQFSAATLLPDLPLELTTEHGSYEPKNYDGRFHGPVRLRRALANSLNVPAVYAANRVGPDRVLELLHRVGFSSLTGDADQYGAAIALGDGEVRLSELAGAYAMLARDGDLLPLRLYHRARQASGATLTRDTVSPTRVLDARVARVLTDILTDDLARSAEFGRNGPLAFPFPVAAKTGTSKGYRDNWTIGYTREVTVAVWAGNFDGKPMTGSSGITGAAPLFHEVMLAAMRGKTPLPLVSHEGLLEAEVCELSGKLATALCPHTQREWFVPETVPRAACDMHEAVAIEPHDGLRAGPACAGATRKVFERYPAEYESFARDAHRPLAPRGFSPHCPGTAATTLNTARVSFPRGGEHFARDPGGPPRQEILLEAQSAAASLRFLVDGRDVGGGRSPFRLPWALARGSHELRVATPDGSLSEPVAFEVR
ncbi:MAG TPA: penicillin-binding transpeptidase domain-containing protein, partial [Polyangiaceae bacterium]